MHDGDAWEAMIDESEKVSRLDSQINQKFVQIPGTC